MLVDRRAFLGQMGLLPVAPAGVALPELGCAAASVSDSPGTVDPDGAGADQSAADAGSAHDVAARADATGPLDGGGQDAGSPGDAAIESDASGMDADSAGSVDAGGLDAGGQDAGITCGEKVVPGQGDVPAHCTATASDMEGPFYEAGSAKTTVLAGPSEPGERLHISGRVLLSGCKQADAGVEIDIWHADAKGQYRDLSHTTPLRATLTADCNGRFAFDTILPGAYLDSGGYRPKHIHFKVRSKQGAELTSQLYFAGDAYLSPNDSCDSCASDEPSLIIALSTTSVGGKKQHKGQFSIVLGV